jgi:hypothetical protein
LTFGYYDKEKFKGKIDWHPVEFKYMFGVRLDDIKINGKRQNICFNQKEKCLITFDSGTTLMSFPTWATVKLSENKIPTSNVVQMCESAKSYGDLTLIIGGKDYTLENEKWVSQTDIHLAQSS